MYHVYTFLIQSLISNACHSLYRVTRGFNILRQIMVTFLTYISNACHSLSGVAERLQHTQTGQEPILTAKKLLSYIFSSFAVATRHTYLIT